MCVFQVSQPYVGFCHDPKHFIVNCEKMCQICGKMGGNVLENAISI